MPPVELECTISERERPQTYALNRMATGTGIPGFEQIKTVFDLLQLGSTTGH